jgi:hypothetical protein
MILFGGLISWRANKQDTVTTSSTEAELLALSQTAREALFIGRLFHALTLELDEPMSVQCDNMQTIRLVCEESMKLQTKLRHVDIHNHWLRQEHAAGRIKIQWVETTRMVADGMTKALGKLKFKSFLTQMGLQDIQGKLDLVRLMEDAKERVLEIQHHGNFTVLKTGGRDTGCLDTVVQDSIRDMQS